jgi:hypothetical protein
MKNTDPSFTTQRDVTMASRRSIENFSTGRAFAELARGVNAEGDLIYVTFLSRRPPVAFKAYIHPCVNLGVPTSTYPWSKRWSNSAFDVDDDSVKREPVRDDRRLPSGRRGDGGGDDVDDANVHCVCPWQESRRHPQFLRRKMADRFDHGVFGKILWVHCGR